MTCEFFQISRKDDDHSLKVSRLLTTVLTEVLFKVWLAENPEVRKLCPKCQSPIEKNGGCLHIHCIKLVYLQTIYMTINIFDYSRCDSHLCWKCMEIFPSGGGVYGHACSARR